MEIELHGEGVPRHEKWEKVFGSTEQTESAYRSRWYSLLAFFTCTNVTYMWHRNRGTTGYIMVPPNSKHIFVGSQKLGSKVIRVMRR